MAASHARPESLVTSPVEDRRLAGFQAVAFQAVLERLSDILNFLNLSARTDLFGASKSPGPRARARTWARCRLTFLTFVRFRTGAFAQERVSAPAPARARTVPTTSVFGGIPL